MEYLLEKIHPTLVAGLIALILSIPVFGVLVTVIGDTIEEYIGLCLGTAIGTSIGYFICIAIFGKF